MRFHIGKPPATPNFVPEIEGWTALKEPSPLMLNVAAVPIGILTAVLIAMSWGSLKYEIRFGDSAFGSLAPLVYLGLMIGVGFPLLLAVHEWIHTLGYTKCGLTSSTMVAIWPSKLLILAITFDALRRNRLLLVYLAPLLAITVLPLVVCRALDIQSTLLALASIVNAACCGGDMIGFCLILWQVPRDALVRNQGWSTWWKTTASAQV